MTLLTKDRVNLAPGLPPLGERPPLTRVRTPAGLYEIRADPAATYIAPAPPWRPVPAGKTVYYAPHVREGYHPLVPKAPVALLGQVVELFKAAGEVEAHVNLVYDPTSGLYALHSTEIEGSARVGCVHYDLVPHSADFFVVAEIHSHHVMDAFFSTTDNAHERRSGVYGVIGRTDLEKPHAAFRYSCGGVFGALAASDIFGPPEDPKDPTHVTDLVEEVEPRWPETGQTP